MTDPAVETAAASALELIRDGMRVGLGTGHRALGLDPVVRLADGRRFISDNGNLTIDCNLATPLADARAARVLEADLRAIPGVVDTGLFLGTAERVLVGYPDGHVDVLQARR
jgi:ribose 5-phosphate isomerase